jgi:hypothetical protein
LLLIEDSRYAEDASKEKDHALREEVCHMEKSLCTLRLV